MTDPATIRRLYGRRQGHKLREGQAALVEATLPGLSLPATGPLDARTLFGDDRPLEVEIGFGGGEHLATQAAARPHMGFIGCEPFLNGVVSALNHIRDGALENVRLHMGDALEVLERLPDAGLDRLYLLHPDPWPKARHAKRRMVNPGPLDLIARKLKPGAEFRLGTDDPTYCRWSMMVMKSRRDFAWQARRPADFLTRPADWPETRYERKARRQGHEVWYFRYLRVETPARHLVIEGAAITDIPSLYAELNRVFMADEGWRLGESLDALHDMLFGGYGALAGAVAATITWRDADKSREALGVAATEHFLRERAAQRTHFNNAPIAAQLDALAAGHGTTYFDIVLDVFAAHPNITLVLA